MIGPNFNNLATENNFKPKWKILIIFNPTVLFKMSLKVYFEYTNNYEHGIFSSIFYISQIFEIIKLFITLVYDLFS